MEEKQAFGRGLRMLRLARGLQQEAFTPVNSLTYTSVIERGRKSASLEKVGELATVLRVHPLTLLTAMYVEMNGSSVHDLLLVVQTDFAELAGQLPTNIGNDPRDRSTSIVELHGWLTACLAGSSAQTLQKELESMDRDIRASVDEVRELGSSLTKDSRKWNTKTYRNPHSGEEVTARSANNGVIRRWIEKYGKAEVQSWVVSQISVNTTRKREE